MAANKKSNEFIAFGWVALQDGYEWIDAHEVYVPPRWGKGWAPAERWLVLRPEAQNRKPRRYNPLEEKTSLFRTFAELHSRKREFYNSQINTDVWAYKSGFSPKKHLPLHFRRKARSW